MNRPITWLLVDRAGSPTLFGVKFEDGAKLVVGEPLPAHEKLYGEYVHGAPTCVGVFSLYVLNMLSIKYLEGKLLQVNVRMGCFVDMIEDAFRCGENLQGCIIAGITAPIVHEDLDPVWTFVTCNDIDGDMMMTTELLPFALEDVARHGRRVGQRIPDELEPLWHLGMKVPTRRDFLLGNDFLCFGGLPTRRIPFIIAMGNLKFAGGKHEGRWTIWQMLKDAFFAGRRHAQRLHDLAESAK